ncbi:hypothetical protein LEP3755_26900 [Leptolyngbya sp. NIES-3755]|nr:hypothetical protein LEP3755_26900 [Leptolyngbya sp. NIES-3755]
MEFAGLPNWNRPLSTELDRGSTIAIPQNYLTQSPTLHHRGSSLIVIDPTIPNYQELIAGLQPDSQVLILDPVQDAIAQITQTLLGQSGISSLHLVSHGKSGGIQLGGTWLDRASLDRYRSEFQLWAKSLTDEADILIYGCEVAQGEAGQAFIRQFSQLTGADIAASDDLTGNAKLNGDWILEANTGEIASAIAFNAETRTQYAGILPVDLISGGNPTLVSGSVGLNNIGRNSVSGNGRYVVFTSSAILSPNDANGTSDVFLYDRTTDTISLISRNFGDTGTAAGNSFNPVISFDGNSIAFISDANDLVSDMNTTEQANNIFVWERSTNAITLVSRTQDGTSGIEDSAAPSISDDGQRIAFQTQSQLLFTDTSTVPDVYVWERGTGLTHVSRNRTDERSRTQGADSPVISGDGNYVAFTSLYTNLAFGDINRTQDVFLWQASNDQVVNLTIDRFSTSASPVISQDGSRVAFVGDPDTSTDPSRRVANVFVWSRSGFDQVGVAQGSIQLVSVDRTGTTSGNATNGFGSAGGSQSPVISRNGNAIAFTSSSTDLVDGDDNNAIDVFVRNLTTNQTVLVSRSSGGAIANGSSGNVGLSADGTRVIFTSTATNLINGDTNAQQDVFVRDLTTSSTFLISRTPTGSVGNNTSGTNSTSIGAPTSVPVLTSDGTTAIFVSLAKDLAPDDTNDLVDGFAVSVAAGNATVFSRRNDDPTLASRTGSGTSTAGANSISEDGRYIVFTSAAPEIVNGDTNGVADVFLRDRQTNTTTLISRGTEIANGASGNAVISANGRYIVFTSAASNLVAGDSNTAIDIFWVDRETQQIRLVSRAIAGGSANAASLTPVVSADGLFVAFTSSATNLVNGDTNAQQDVFLWNSADNSIVLVSAGSNGTSEQPVMSEDGRFVAFVSAGSNLVSGDTNGQRDVFVWDRTTGAIALVSQSTGGVISDGDSSQISISRNGRLIAFTSTARNLAGTPDVDSDEDVFVRNLETNTTVHVSANQAGGYSTTPQTGPNAGFSLRAFNPVISGNGQYVVFTSDFDNLVAGDANSANDVFRRDLATGTTQLISVNQSGTGSGSGIPGSDGGTGGGSGSGSSSPAISNDGRFVVFSSFSNDLVNGDNNGALDVFVRDTTSNITSLVSSTVNDVNSGRGASFAPVISGNGGYIVFNSRATDLVPRDLNGTTDVFGLNLATTVSIAIVPDTVQATAESSSPSPVQYRIWRNRSVGELTVKLAIDASSTATIDLDYLLGGNAGLNLTRNGSELTIQLADGVEEAFLTLNPINDTIVENEEVVNLSLVATPDYSVAESFGTTSLRIIDNDIPILVSVSNTTVDSAEGNADEKEFTFQIKLDTVPFTAPVTVRYATQTGTAGTDDFTETFGEVTFGMGEDTKTVVVRVKGDTQFEADETFSFVLSDPSANARIANGQGTAIATITNDDTVPTVTISGATSINEGDTGSQDYVFTVSLSEVSSTEVEVDYVIRDLTSTIEVDYAATPTRKVTFAPGQTTQTIVVSVKGDRLFEVDEQFQIELSNPTGAILRDDQKLVTGTIVDNDTAPTLTIEAASEQSENTTPYTFTVRLSEASGRPVTVDYETIAGTALTGEDFTATTGTLTFAPGETSQTIQIAIADNAIRESNESFSVRLTNPIDATITTESAIATIVDNDAIPTVSITNVSQAEGNSGSTVFQFEVTLSNASDQEIVLNYSTKDGTATIADNDYERVESGIVRFAPGTTSQIVTVNVKGDTKREREETFSVELSTATPTLVTIPTTAIGVGTIQTDDSAFPVISVSPATVREGGILSFTVSLSEVSDEVITVNVSTSDGAAKTDDLDYTAIANRTVTFNPNELIQTIEIQTTSDNKLEPDETINLTLSNAVNGTIDGTGTATGTIVNDDQRPTLTITSPALSEDDSIAENYPFTIRLSNPTTETVTVKYRTIEGAPLTDSALVSDNDYVAANGTVTFNPGEVEKTIFVRVNADRKFEPTERFIVRLEDALNADISSSATDAFGVLTNDDAEPELSIRSVTRSEGNSGKTAFQFVVSLNNPSSQEIRVNYTTVEGLAIAGSDFDATNGTLVFAPGTEEQIITVNVNGDADFEPEEAFLVRLSDPINAKLSNTEVRGTIVNDDGVVTPTIQIEDVVAPEGSADQTYTFKVRLSQATTNTVTVQYRTDDGSARTLDNDYVGITSPQTLTFNPGEIEKEISIVVRGDTKFEQNEFFFVDLLNPTNANLSTVSRGRGVISNDDATPTISIGTVAVAEGNDGFVNATFTVSLSNSSDQTIEVNYATDNGTAKVDDEDFEQTSGKLTFLPGITSQTITVRVRGDFKFEPDEFFTVRLSSPVNANLFDAPNQGVGTIQSDDFRPTISISDTSLLPVTEGNSANTPARFTVRLSNPSSETVTVKYVTRNITTNDSDYTAVNTPATLTFAPGQTEQFIELQVIGDTRFEPDETFSIELSDPTNAQIATGRTVATIRNDDPVPQLSISAVPPSKAEGNEGTTPFTFEVSLSDASFVPITVSYTTIDGTATTANKDYLQATNTLTFAPGETKKTITIDVLGDTEFEGDETFQIRLNTPNNATIQTALAIATIVGDDTPDNTDDSDSLYDILWRNRRTGENLLWMPSGTFLDREIPLPSVRDPLWRIVGTADFDNDGALDVFWRNAQTGENQIWRTNPDLTFAEIDLPTVSGDWEVAGIGDFNGDRSPDLFWRNSLNGGNVVWLLRGTTPFFGVETAQVAQPGWRIKSIADFDNDGKSDLFWSNQNNGATAIWLMDGTSPRFGRLLNQVADVMWQPVSAGDVNRDGFADLIWRHGRSGENVVWFMKDGWVTGSITLPVVPDANWKIEQVFDFNADQNLDILWRQTVSQETVIWFLNGEQVGTAALLPSLPDRNWQIEGTGKFGNPSKGEILLRNYQTGENRLWRIHRDLFNRTVEMESQSIDWEIQGTADFDQNGSADVLWRNLRTRELSIWLTDRGAVLSKVTVPAGVIVTNDWKIVGVADFSADGSPDILWRNQNSGGLSMWLFNGTQVVSGFELPSTDSGWRIEGVTDLNGDRNPDLLWRHSLSGELAFWFFDRTQVRLGVLGPVVPTNWQIKDFGDFNRDGRMDLVWRNDGSNETVLWMMDGSRIVDGVVLPSALPSWDIAGVGDFNLDNQIDLIWRDRTNGTNAVWYLNNGRFALSNFIPAIRDIDWQVKDINDF